jgi:hypothetical protein
MKKVKHLLKTGCIVLLCLAVAGCATIPKGFLKPEKDALQLRQLETRQYDTKDDEKIIKAVAGLLQDLGFTLDSSETKLGFVAASKKADATNGGQIAGAVALDVLGVAACLFGVPAYTNAYSRCEKAQLVKASVIVQPSLDGSKMVVRATFQRLVWNMTDKLSKIETISEPQIYKKFYDGLSKAIFLEAQQI